MWSPVPWIFIGQTFNSYFNEYFNKAKRIQGAVKPVPLSSIVTHLGDYIINDILRTFKLIGPLINLNLMIIMKYIFITEDNTKTIRIFEETSFKNWCGSKMSKASRVLYKRKLVKLVKSNLNPNDQRVVDGIDGLSKKKNILQKI